MREVGARWMKPSSPYRICPFNVIWHGFPGADWKRTLVFLDSSEALEVVQPAICPLSKVNAALTVLESIRQPGREYNA